MPEPFEYTRPEVTARLEDWQMIRATLGGEKAVKALGDKVLPRPNADDTSAANRQRFLSYLRRATFYPVTGRTLNGMLGYVFANEPKLTVPDVLSRLTKDVDGRGVGIVAQSKAVLTRVLAFGRCGLLVDYPITSQVVTRQELLDGKVSPSIVLYEPEDIINWDMERIGNEFQLRKIVLRETELVTQPDGFNKVEQVSYRVIELVSAEGGGNTVKVTVNRLQKVRGRKPTVTTTVTEPKDKDAKPLTSIPFVFVGADNNDPDVDHPPLLDLAMLNLAHYRNSADYEESCYLVGQPTLALSGLTKDWVDNVLMGSVKFGSRAPVLLPVGGQAQILQAEGNTLPKEAMDQKEKQMVALGARLIQETTITKTATEVVADKSSEVSTLVAAATNVFAAYRNALNYCGLFVGAGDATLSFDITEPMAPEVLDQDKANAVILLWNAGLLTFEETRKSLRKTGTASQGKDEKALEAEAVKRRDEASVLAVERAKPH